MPSYGEVLQRAGRLAHVLADGGREEGLPVLHPALELLQLDDGVVGDVLGVVAQVAPVPAVAAGYAACNSDTFWG